MRVKLIGVIALLALVASLATVDAAWMVYKGKGNVDEYTEDGSNLELDRSNKLKFDVYIVLDSDYDISTDAPQRIVVFKIKRQKVSPAEYDASTQSWVADAAAKEVNKLILSPLEYTWTAPTGSVTTDIEDNYGGTLGDQYIVYGGEWSNVSIIGADGADKNYLAMVEYYEGAATDDLKGYTEYYSGKIKKGLAKSLKGGLSYYTNGSETDDGIVGIAKRMKMRYDKKMSEKESSVYNATTIEEAVEAVMTILVEKKHASTWAE